MRVFGLILIAAATAARVFAQGAPTLELTNFSGVWQETVHEDNYERSGGPPLGDYQGIPLNDAVNGCGAIRPTRSAPQHFLKFR